jgi:uncharacterized coiled-coil protein SlyX
MKSTISDMKGTVDELSERYGKMEGMLNDMAEKFDQLTLRLDDLQKSTAESGPHIAVDESDAGNVRNNAFNVSEEVYMRQLEITNTQVVYQAVARLTLLGAMGLFDTKVLPDPVKGTFYVEKGKGEEKRQLLRPNFETSFADNNAWVHNVVELIFKNGHTQHKDVKPSDISKAGRPFWHGRIKVAFEGLCKKYRENKNDKAAATKFKSKMNARKREKAKGRTMHRHLVPEALEPRFDCLFDNAHQSSDESQDEDPPDPVTGEKKVKPWISIPQAFWTDEVSVDKSTIIA